MNSIFNIFANHNVVEVFKILYYTSFVWLPVLLFILAFELWVDWRRAMFFAKQTYILLEIKLPKEIFKSPRAMEFMIAGLNQPFGDGNWFLDWWKGSTRPWFSLEIVSIGGEVHFFIWTRKSYRNAIEANLYSQYPGIEIYEVPDYTLPMSFDPATVGMMTCEFGLTKADVFPIKTYVDYGMDKDPKEEYKIDPLTPLIEFFGTLKKGHQAWFQIVVRAHKATDKDPVTGKLVDLAWAKAAKVEIDKIYEGTKGKKDDATGKEDKGRLLTDGEMETVKALERSISKPGFDVGMRAIYMAPKDIFDRSNIGGVIGGITHFNSNNLNAFKPTIAGSKKYPWIDRKDKVANFEKGVMFDAYKRRQFFYKPYKRGVFVLNSEELATVYHFPGGVSATPTFERIGSRKAEAPQNLPI
ncbi:MAG: hypothetical protein WCK48_02685 [bacterium]